MDKWQVYKKTDEFRVQAPKSVLDVVEIKSIDEHGIFEVHIPLERNSQSATAERLSAPNGKFVVS